MNKELVKVCDFNCEVSRSDFANMVAMDIIGAHKFEYRRNLEGTRITLVILDIIGNEVFKNTYDI